MRRGNRVKIILPPTPVSGQNSSVDQIIGQIRKSQFITTFGPGAVVNFKDYSCVIGAPYEPKWEDHGRVIHDRNLERLLHVSEFKEPPVISDSSPKAEYTEKDLIAYRFPKWCYCKKCGKLAEAKYLQSSNDPTRCAFCHEKLIPSRFLIACVNGHLADFPYEWWVHNGEKCPYPHVGNREHKHYLQIEFSGDTGDLASIRITCPSCNATRTMAGALSPAMFKNYHCHGERPWLGNRSELNEKDCEAKVKPLQRSASNIYYSVTKSALTIPPWSTETASAVLKHPNMESFYNQIRNDPVKLEDYFKSDPFFARVLRHMSASTLAGQIDSILKIDRQPLQNFDFRQMMEDEYGALTGGNRNDELFVTEKVEVPDLFEDYIENCVKVRKLREVLALVGFWRIYPVAPDPGKKEFEGYEDHQFYPERPECIPSVPVDSTWLPAVSMLGEGVFLTLKEDKVHLWEEKNGHHYYEMRKRLYSSPFKMEIQEKFSPRYVLLHTLAHLLIRQMVTECGYSEASLKERIYSTYPGREYPMAGILIYTSSPDSDGSLGGLARQGDTESMKYNLLKMLENASWCSSDPLCIESKAQGYQSLNYAACHACTLLPETCCEAFNCLLDRGAVVGTFDNTVEGYFNDILYNLMA
ncbi:DUF1998 domain-containing protein [uncultured Dialister sp.]|uniref:DUF1998 domain-containing protein n=1 Tax=uncultured Dialister sp. TaxID=278064 RepID=UPI0025F1BC43|nr:DUF1998 domain-containing protein [uncultured Dialister sp.]